MTEFDRGFNLRHFFELTADPPGEIRYRAITASNYNNFADAVEDGVEWAGRELQRNPQLKQNHSEDQLTLEIISMLRAMGFQASHDTMVGGHGDIIVEGRNSYLWIGEAKIYTSYVWLRQGFDQLNTRYSTGANGEGRGGIIVYVKIRRADQILLNWRSTVEKEYAGVSIESCPKNDRMAFVTVMPHDRTGADFRVRHLAISLYYAPTPSSAGLRR